MSTWPALALRAWKAYVFARGLGRALQLGAAGLSAGASAGLSLAGEQTARLGGALCAGEGMVGSPYADLLWCQAVGALLVGVVSEVVNLAVLGGLGGMALGFVAGYAAAIRGTVCLVGRAGRGALGQGSRLADRLVRIASALHGRPRRTGVSPLPLICC